MFGLFRRRDQYPELSVADRLLISERKAANARWLNLYERWERLRWGDETRRAHAWAIERDAWAHMKRLDAEYDAMMVRLQAEAAAALIEAAKES